MDREVDDIIKNLNRKQSIKSGKKGKRAELELVKLLNDRFSELLRENSDWGHFSRSLGSGNRWGQNVHLSKKAMETFSGDLSVPENFGFVLESKCGYNEIDLNSAFEGGCKELDAFLNQVTEDSNRCGRRPLLVWKKDRRPRIAFVKTKDIPLNRFEYYMIYRDWTAVLFSDLLSFEDSFFFGCSK